MNRQLSVMLCLLGISTLFCGCASLRPRTTCSWDRSVLRAMTAPETVLPLVAAGVIAVNGSDAQISEWASTTTPVFGSRENAVLWSDILDNGVRAAGLVTALLVPEDKSRFITADLATQGVTGAVNYAAKVTARRERPDGSNDLSFPSGHSSDAAANAIAASRTVEYLRISPLARTTLRAGVITSAAGTAWARVEGKKHYPTDVLVGFALGSALANIIYDAYVPENVHLAFVPLSDTAFLKVWISY